MHCLHWLLPVPPQPHPVKPLYLLSFLLEWKPCTICALVFLEASASHLGSDSPLPELALAPGFVGT
ncbi:hypothetical protein H1C71_023113, partial [Ictidomys tridecemlineatus]|uniref:Uncharacterized protein n=1 Tax=Ictidomys tridecemlineatus TaxID=43179 RepID=A0A287DF80_ICTTR